MINTIAGVIVKVFEDGGPVLWIIAVAFFWGLGIIIAKAQHLNRDRIINPSVITNVEKLLREKKLPEATAYCRQNTVPMTRVILAGIVNHERNEAQLKEILEDAGRQEIPGIRQYMTTLGTIAAVAPLLGLLGTVLGMIEVFSTLSTGSGINANDLAGGISKALITTAAGLGVAMPMIVFHNGFSARAGNLIIEMERISLHMVAVLHRAR